MPAYGCMDDAASDVVESLPSLRFLAKLRSGHHNDKYIKVKIKFEVFERDSCAACR
jgi:hypothetical protein